MLELRQVGKSFGACRALDGVDLAVAAGTVHALVGENGAGKSTLIRIVTGALAPDAGEVRVAGALVEEFTPARASSLGIAVVHQEPALLRELTAAENLWFGSDGRWISWRARRERSAALLLQVGARFGPDAVVGELTTAEQQLLQIARALRTPPRLLVLDEPTAVLGEGETERLFTLLHELRTLGTAVLYVSHRLTELGRLADTVTVLRDGRRVATGPLAGMTRDQLIHHMVGRPVTGAAARSAARTVPRGAPALAVQALSCRSAGLHDISFTLHAGEVLGLAGLVGAGRTELCECLFGLRPFERGTVHRDGQKLRLRSPADALAASMALVPEDRRVGVVGELSLAANVSLPQLEALATRTGMVDREAEQVLAQRAVDRFQVKSASLTAEVATLSGGNQQKVALARWLLRNPRVLLLDEPTQGIDVGARAQIHRLVRAQVEAGVAVLLVSSDLPELLELADRIAVLHAGTLTGILDRADATQERVLALALGHAS